MALACSSSSPTPSSRTAKTSVRCTRGLRIGTAAVLLLAMGVLAADALSRGIRRESPDCAALICQHTPGSVVETTGRQQQQVWTFCGPLSVASPDEMQCGRQNGQACHNEAIIYVQPAMQTCCCGSANMLNEPKQEPREYVSVPR